MINGSDGHDQKNTTDQNAPVQLLGAFHHHKTYDQLRLGKATDAAYPSGLCAERVALFHAGHQYPDMPVVALAIAAATNGRQVESISPCGACRQVLLEAEQRYGKPMKVLLCGTKEVVVAESAESLLPLCFGAKDLK